MDAQSIADNIIAEIEKDRDWRVNEFFKMKSIHYDIKNNQKYNLTYLSMCIPIIYAHWEGFCTNSFRIITNHINDQKLTYNRIINSLFTYSQKATYDYLKGKQGFQQRCKFSKQFVESLNRNHIKIDSNFNAKSNLKFKILLEYFEIFDEDISHLKKF